MLGSVITQRQLDPLMCHWLCITICSRLPPQLAGSPPRLTWVRLLQMFQTNLSFSPSWHFNLCVLLLSQWSCCGAHGPDDWNLNIYFNCTDLNPSRERCGVPFSCCHKDPAVSHSTKIKLNELKIVTYLALNEWFFVSIFNIQYFACLEKTDKTLWANQWAK